MKVVDQQALLRRLKTLVDLFQNEATDHDGDGERCWTIYPEQISPREIRALQRILRKEVLK